jgi:hypothetical protein
MQALVRLLCSAFPVALVPALSSGREDIWHRCLPGLLCCLAHTSYRNCLLNIKVISVFLKSCLWSKQRDNIL